MKLLKRLQVLEERLNQVSRTKELETEYRAWVDAHPLGALGDHSFDFYQWMDSMPKHLVPCFQQGLNNLLSSVDLVKSR